MGHGGEDRSTPFRRDRLEGPTRGPLEGCRVRGDPEGETPPDTPRVLGGIPRSIVS